MGVIRCINLAAEAFKDITYTCIRGKYCKYDQQIFSLLDKHLSSVGLRRHSCVSILISYKFSFICFIYFSEWEEVQQCHGVSRLRSPFFVLSVQVKFALNAWNAMTQTILNRKKIWQQGNIPSCSLLFFCEYCDRFDHYLYTAVCHNGLCWEDWH